jgi:3-methyladenine DNA glycosylase AlkD
MAEVLRNIRKELRAAANPQKAIELRRFFKTGKGEYAEGDKFLGVMVPQTRRLVKKYWREITLAQTSELLTSRYHEERLLALLLLVGKFEKGNEAERKAIFDLYLANTKFINNWDLVDLTAPRIVGGWLENKSKRVLLKMAKSESLWERRIAMLATFWSIGKGEPEFALRVAEILVYDKEDLIHKAVGWGLREVGKRCGQGVEEDFLQKYHKTMPRTMLRCAIERFSPEIRECYLRV